MTIKGQAGAKYLGKRSRYVPGTGITTVDVYAVDSIADADSFAASQYSSGNVAETDTTRLPYTVEVSSPTSTGGTVDDDYFDKWEVVRVESDLSIFEHPKFQSLSASEQHYLREYHKDGSSESYDAALAAIASADGLEFLALLRKGQDHFKAASTQIRWTRTVGDGYSNLGGTYDGIFEIWTAAQLISFGVPPQLYEDAIIEADTGLAVGAPGFYGGWLKEQPSIVTRGQGRSDIVQEWTLQNWSTFIYPFY